MATKIKKEKEITDVYFIQYYIIYFINTSQICK
jgi:hypothetical protein